MPLELDLELSILLAEDSKFFATAIEDSLRKHVPNLSFDKVTILNEIENKLIETSPDVLVLDLYFPNGDTIHKIKEFKEKFPNMFIIVASSQSNIRTALKTLEEGADHYVVKDAGFSSDLLVALNSISNNLKIQQQLKQMTESIYEPNNYPVVVYKASEVGVSVDIKDFDTFPEDLENTQNFLHQLGLSLLVSLGQGHEYHEGVYEFPTVNSKFYTAIVIAFRIEDPDSEDQRLQKEGYYHICMFIPNSFRSMLPPLSELTFIIDYIKKEISNSNDVNKESIWRIKFKLLEFLKNYSLSLKK